ncbi:DUF5977 domain-containing protein [Chitinophaga sancti]|uniref:DUF5977 domain-containing protein n=1 Tax=Chitinophaga sancti TaxID=1004 RepID=UPI002A75E4A1|nr:DUF5977 domain-containing protein [Chitinophaga sancti]WPQ61474.1 DUF5977 domain-containing protein [Chitinophaga sancti]
MILKHVAGSKRLIASLMLVVMYLETVLPDYAFGAPVMIPVSVTTTRTPLPVWDHAAVLPAEKSTPAALTTTSKAFIGGPTQPESQDFHSVNSDNMVDLFSGDFSYSIPLLDVGGYPLALGYNSGVGMDQDASWVGLGWNLNPGSITRNLRGLPDDFNGTDTIQQVSAMKPNVSAGVSVALSEELLGLPLNKLTGSDSASLSLSLTASVGINYNNYKGWGMETGLSPSINVGSASMGKLTAGLSLTNSSTDGFTVGTSLDYRKNWERTKETGTLGGSVGLSTGFNSRSGMKALTLGLGTSMTRSTTKNQTGSDGKTVTTTTNQWGRSPGASRTIMSFAYPSYSPAVTLPYTNTNLTFTLKVGTDASVSSSTLAFEGYYAKQEIKEADQRRSLPAYGYLNFQGAGNNTSVLMDYNREKDIPYREKPAVPNIGIPSYTYDVFAMSGEGTGGSFRAYRSDIGHVFDHYNKTKFVSGTAGADLSAGGLVHAGATIGLTYAYTENGAWLKDNIFYTQTPFTSSLGTYEGSYFRNPGEMTVNDKEYYTKLGGDDVVTVKLNQSSTSSSTLQATKYLSRYQNKKWVADEAMDTLSSMRTRREKRNQVISYLTAEEAGVAGFPRFIENYSENYYSLTPCPAVISDDVDGDGVGLLGQYYIHRNFEKKLYEKVDTVIYMPNQAVFNYDRPATVTPLNTKWSARWTGRIKAPVTGDYTFYLDHDDGVRLFLNDTSLIDRFGIVATTDSAKVNLVAGQYYKIRMDYNNNKGGMRATLEWKYPSQDRIRVPTENLYLTSTKDTLMVDSISIEKRVNSFRQKNHISEIDVTNADGKRYIYGLPVYNLQQKEATFSVDASKGNADSGLVKYTPGSENSTGNSSGNDHYYSSELMPAYAHTFLLTALLSPDYQDLTGNGITADDKGDAIKFNYTKIAGINNPYNWRSPAPAIPNQASLHQGQRTDNRDDKGSYVYGQKELWYLHSIESKNMVAIFKLASRDDLPAIDENGVRQKGNYGRKLEEINLYTKSELMKANPKPIKTVHFEYSYDLCKGANGRINAEGKLTLKKIWFTYNNNQKGKRHPYVFYYNGVNPDYNSKDVDRWGSYKSSSQNPSQVNNNDYPYSLQDSTLAAQNAAAWTLDSIQLPAGGRIKVDYESDDYAYVQNKRAAQMYTIAGFSLGAPNSTEDLQSNLYNGLYDNQYVSINVPKAVSSNAEVYTRYLEGMEKVYFRLYVKMPADKYGSGSEYVPVYATLDQSKYGFFNGGNTIYIRVKAISTNGEIDMATSLYSPLTKAAFSYLRMNLPSKAYPGSETGDNVSAVDVIKILASQASNIVQMLATFDNAARIKNWARAVDLGRSFVRLNNPYYKKYGGGIRVKRIRIFDNWNEMTKQKESVYGQEYIYTTTKEVNGKTDTISSGVATYEPMIGADENPWRTPLEYNQQVAALAPIVNGYTELPLGESFFPSPSVGYSKVRVRTIHANKTRSANGYGENCYYTSYDFPTLTDMTLLADNKKRYKPALSNLLRINAKHYIAVSQGFKVELNDMNGRLKSQASYSETNTTTPVTSTTNYYRVDDQQATTKHLNNTVMAMTPKGMIDTTAVIGKDMELMTDMREERSVSTAVTVQVNGDMFTFPWPPIMFIPVALSVYNKEETMYHSAAVAKVIYRHGILDSVVVTDKDSKISTRNLLYDSETGNVLLTSTQNEFNDPIYNFTMPAGWAYDGMSGAYKNTGVILKNIYIRQGRITSGLSATAKVTDYFAGGDKVLIYSKPKTGGEDCAPHVATFPATGLMYTVDANEQHGGSPDIYFVDENGQPFSGNDITLKVVKSGRKNIGAAISNVSLLKNPLVQTSTGYKLVIDSTSKVIAASAVQYKSAWKVPDSRKSGTVTTCVPESYAKYAGGDAANCGVTQTSYGNHLLSRSYIVNNCSSGYIGKYAVSYVVPANKFYSTVSQAAADSMAQKLMSDSGQLYANAHGVCIAYYTSTAQTATASKNNCAAGSKGGTASYTVGAGFSHSYVSQAAADSTAYAWAYSQAQAQANNSTCYYYSVAQSGSYTKNNCASGGTGGSVSYSLAAGTDSSSVSQAAADSLAKISLASLGQAYANANGTCTFYNTAVSVTKTRNNCGTGGTGSSVTYTVAAGKWSSTVSQAKADSLANVDLSNNAQTYANTNGTCTFYNTAVSVTKTRNNCSTGGTGSSVTYTVAAGKYSSTVSQAGADSLASADLTANAQTYANTNGYCTFYNTAVSLTKTRNNCATGGTGSSVTYTVAANKYSSTVSQSQADSLANLDLNNNAQTYANTNGTCTFYNTAVSATMTRNNCSTGGTGSSVTYTVAANKYSSTVSQSQADSLANVDLNNNAQTYANTNGTCTFYNTAVSSTKTRNNCGTNGTGSSVTYTVAANKYSSTVSQVSADSLANVDLTNNAQTYANTNGSCTYTNDAMSRTYTRNNCGTGYTGSSVTYSVAAGKYTSTVSYADANSKAAADTLANGQTYANTNGTCTLQAVTITINTSPSGYTANTAHGNISVKTSSGTSIVTGTFDGTDLFSPLSTSKTYTTTATTFTITIAAMTAAYASVNGSAKNVYSSSQTWTVTGSTITILLYYK